MVSAPRCRPGARGLLTLLLLLPLPGARASCGTTPRLKSAVLSKEDEKKNYHAHGTTVSYVCRPGYEETELRPVITCLEDFTWSEAPEFCRGKSCGVPIGPAHGRAVNIANYLYGARVNIICDEGFRLHGRPFIQCMLKGHQVEWSQLPTCEAIITQDKPTTVPPKGTEVAGTSSDSALNTIGNFTELEDSALNTIGNFTELEDSALNTIGNFTELEDSALNTIGNFTELEDSALNTIGNFTELEVIITQDKPTTVPPKGTEVAGTSSDVITQDKHTTVPLKGTEVAGTSSGSALNTAGNSAEPEGEGPGILTRITNFIGIGPCIDKCIGTGIGIVIGVACFVIVAFWIIQCQKKKSSYSVNPDSPKCQITT